MINDGAPHVAAEDCGGWFDRPVVRRSIQIGLIVSCVLLLLAEFGYHHDHPHFEQETIFGFQAWIGFGAFVAAVACGSLLRRLVMRPEDFYEYRDVPSASLGRGSHEGERDEAVS